MAMMDAVLGPAIKPVGPRWWLRCYVIRPEVDESTSAISLHSSVVMIGAAEVARTSVLQVCFASTEMLAKSPALKALTLRESS